jgi:hypothetical protein
MRPSQEPELELPDERPGYFRAVRDYQLEEAVIDTDEYLSKRLPLRYPAGGIQAWLKRGLEVKLWYGEDDSPPTVPPDAELRAVIEHRGSSHHLDYKLYVHQTAGGIKADFRGILGDYRFRKIQAMLMLAGVPESCVKRIFPPPRKTNEEIVERDLAGLADCKIAVVGGLSSIARTQAWTCAGETIASNRSGRVVNFEVRKLRLTGRTLSVAFLTYPYGDLAMPVGNVLAGKGVVTPFFVGSAGSLSTGLARGDAVCPSKVVGWDLDDAVDFENLLATEGEWDGTTGHCSVQNPLQESGRFVARAVRRDIVTADCEVHSFLRGFRRNKKHFKVGVALFVTDEAWRAEKDISQLSYAREAVSTAARRCFDSLQGALIRIAKTSE